jgi:hypothetical protein
VLSFTGHEVTHIPTMSSFLGTIPAHVGVSDGRDIRADGSVIPIGSTVDVAAASYANSIGDVEIRTTWLNPYFDASEPAFYCLRVLEIPTPRWTAYDARFFAVEDIASEVPMVTQERVHPSPIWYQPASPGGEMGNFLQPDVYPQPVAP